MSFRQLAPPGKTEHLVGCDSWAYRGRIGEENCIFQAEDGKETEGETFHLFYRRYSDGFSREERHAFTSPSSAGRIPQENLNHSIRAQNLLVQTMVDIETLQDVGSETT
ncbi:hypothetical protein QLX08_011609 [Tetragonisca angustula]|uniref:Uncharacterized protein n=1 Tax=Tetragonisca angustula TaxID=166442 RepID=A0AAW0Z7T4_9HYME